MVLQCAFSFWNGLCSSLEWVPEEFDSGALCLEGRRNHPGLLPAHDGFCVGFNAPMFALTFQRASFVRSHRAATSTEQRARKDRDNRVDPLRSSVMVCDSGQQLIEGSLPRHRLTVHTAMSD